MDPRIRRRRRGRPKKTTPEKNWRKTEVQKKRRAQIREEWMELKRQYARGYDQGKTLLELEPLRIKIRSLAAALNNVRGHEWFSKTPKAVKQHRQLIAPVAVENEFSSTQSPQQQDQMPQMTPSSQAPSSSTYADETDVSRF